jgi:hypothetical protein
MAGAAGMRFGFVFQGVVSRKEKTHFISISEVGA